MTRVSLLIVAVLLLGMAFRGGADRIEAQTAGTLQIFGAADPATGPGFPENTASNLYRINPTTGAGTLIGPIGFDGVSGIDFDPVTGALYGVGRRHSDDQQFLITINTQTGVGTIVGPTGPTGSTPTFNRVPDISFRNDGQLFIWAESPDRLGSINKATGQATIFGANVSGFGNALGFTQQNVLYHFKNAGVGGWGTLNTSSGEFTGVAQVTYSSGAHQGLNAMDFDPVSGQFYASVIDTFACSTPGPTCQLRSLGRLNPSNGAVTIIGSSVVGLDAIALRYLQPETRPNISGAIGAIAAGADGTRDNLARQQAQATAQQAAAAAAQPQPLPAGMLRPPSTGDAGLVGQDGTRQDEIALLAAVALTLIAAAAVGGRLRAQRR